MTVRDNILWPEASKPLCDALTGSARLQELQYLEAIATNLAVIAHALTSELD